MECHGVPEFVIVNGRVCVDEEQLRAVQGHGKFIETPTFAPYVYDPEKLAELKPIRNGNGADGELELKVSEVRGSFTFR